MNDASTSRTWVWILGLATAAVAARVALGVLTWEPGWSALTWDDFTRVGIAQAWADDPFWFYGFVWLPLPIWITGSMYAVAGESFTANPMALMAIINTTAVFLVAALATWSAHRIFRDPTGSLIVFVLVLFAPWNYFLSLSGLAEPLYFIAISTAVAGLVAWAVSGRNLSLAVGSVGVAAAAGMRYDGWWFAAAWLAVITVDSLLIIRQSSLGAALKERSASVLIAGAPLAVPFVWMVVNLAKQDSPLYFARESARMFTFAYGGFDRPIERVVYYPFALIRSAPFLLLLEGVVGVVRRHRRAVILVVALFGTQFALFYATSLPTRALGAFPERFLFAIALGLAPLVGGLPGVLRDLVPARFLKPAALAIVVVAVLVTAVRLSDRPEEWTHAPDLLALNEQIGIVTPIGQIAIIAAPNTVTDHTPIGVQNGNRVAIGATPDPAAMPGTIGDLSFERAPDRILEFGLVDSPAIGRYRLAGPDAEEFRMPACAGCDGWIWIDEGGHERALEGGPYLGFQFVSEDPLPGERTAITKTIGPSDQDRSGSVDLRGLWGHGFNRGRMSIVVTLNDTVLSESDIGEPSRWRTVGFDIPPGTESHQLSVSVVALPGIETGWGWGTASGVLVRELVVEPK